MRPRTMFYVALLLINIAGMLTTMSGLGFVVCTLGAVASLLVLMR